MNIAKTIAQQIGNRAFFMMGAKDLMGDSNSLTFRISGSRTISHVRVTLEPSDTYKVECLKYRSLAFKTVSEDDGIYADMLNRIISSRTGLALSL